jgi:hypothetical protein
MWCIALHACFYLFGPATDYEQFLASVQIPRVDRLEDATAIVVPAAATQKVDVAQLLARVDSGALLITEGDSALARSLGLTFANPAIEVTQVADAGSPKIDIVWEKPVKVTPPSLPAGATVVVKDKWTGAPLAMIFSHGMGRVFFLATELKGHSRFPYFIQTLIAECGVTPPFRAERLHAFFDYGYRTGVDLDYFARRWRHHGVAALHVSAWQFWDRVPERDEYLRKLIEACHREGVLVYAWFELPHVSNSFYRQHPAWREKTATLADADLDWRGLINLLHPQAFQAVSNGMMDLLADFDWDGLNLAELYFESPQGPENAQRFTPMNDQVRAEFRQQAGFDPVEFFSASSDHYYQKDTGNWERFVDYRAGLVTRLHEQLLQEIAKARARKPYLDTIVTFVDNLYEPRTKEALGVDAARMSGLSARYPFTLIVEDPASMWSLGPDRYRLLGEKYASKRVAAGIDINIVDRYQDVFPTKKQTGGEFLELFHSAAAAFSPVLAYFEASLLPRDMDVVAYALAAGARVTDTATMESTIELTVESTVESPRPVFFRTNAVTVDGQPWPARTGDSVLLPAGRHTVANTGRAPGFELTHLTGDLLGASYKDTRTITFTYSSTSRAIALFSPPASLVLVDGAVLDVGESVILPPGRHTVQAEQ